MLQFDCNILQQSPVCLTFTHICAKIFDASSCMKIKHATLISTVNLNVNGLCPTHLTMVYMPLTHWTSSFLL